MSTIEPDVSSRINAASQPGKFFLRNELVLGRAAMLSKPRLLPLHCTAPVSAAPAAPPKLPLLSHRHARPTLPTFFHLCAVFAGAAAVEAAFGGRAPLAVAGLITPGVKLSQAPLWLQLAIALFAVGGSGIFSGFDSNKDPDTY